MRMTDIAEFKGTLKVLGSGLRIGGTGEVVGIGEMENPIIRHPITHIPYIPGSSVKGKIRCLLEQKEGRFQANGGPCDCGKCSVCILFGCGGTRNLETPTRLVFRDAQPTTETQNRWQEAGVDSEVKTEVSISRRTGAARHGALQSSERIPAGSDFDFAFSLRVFEGDDVAKFYNFLAEGFELLSKHYLGGSGSRGYGEVLVVAEDGVPMHDYLRTKAEQTGNS